jgi:integrase
MWFCYILPELKHRKLADLHSHDIDDLHRRVSVVGQVRANRVVENFRSALNLAVKWGQLSKNPADGFSRNREEPRSIYLTREQVLVAMEALNQLENQQAANAIRLIILTGARMGEVLRAEWDQFDLKKGVWTKPSSHTKQRRAHRVPLSVEACQLLQRMQADAGTSPYLLPSTNGKTIPDVKRPWERIKEALGMPKLRIHDLRHTYASLLISAGEPLPVIGQLLGHPQYQTTLRYAHLRAATNRIGVITTADED